MFWPSDCQMTITKHTLAFEHLFVMAISYIGVYFSPIPTSHTYVLIHIYLGSRILKNTLIYITCSSVFQECVHHIWLSLH